jgi:hypothetical protein
MVRRPSFYDFCNDTSEKNLNRLMKSGAGVKFIPEDEKLKIKNLVTFSQRGNRLSDHPHLRGPVVVGRGR